VRSRLGVAPSVSELEPARRLHGLLAMEAWHSIRDAGHAIVRELPGILTAILVFGLFFTAGRLTLRFCRRIALVRGRSTNLGTVIGRLAQGTLVMLGLLVGASIVLPSFHARDLIQILGIGGIAVGFAFRDVFQNFLSGILLLLAEPFRIGDEIEFAGQRGEVEDVQIRATLIRAADGRLVVVPNTKLFVESVIVRPAPRPSNWSHRRRPIQSSGPGGAL
jgi:small-conductance mechanosensitive channel